MHDATDFTNPPARRLGALALIRDDAGKVLLVEKTYRSGPARWGLPGGCAHEGEPAPAACAREVAEETGLTVTPGPVLTVHHMPADGRVHEGVNVVFDCGTILANTVVKLGTELVSHRWTDPEELRGLVAPYTEWRINASLDTLSADLTTPGTPYLVGEPPMLATDEREPR